MRPGWRAALTPACLLALGACAQEPARRVDAPAPPPAPPPAQQYGSPIDPEAPRVALADLLEDPTEHAGKTVRTEGQIERVCQRMGCWMELADGTSGALRVPMAGHSFFLPQTVRGKRASVQGTVQVAQLSAAHKEHLESEGARATASDISLAATGVVVQQ
jgi:hypothetical protein